MSDNPKLVFDVEHRGYDIQDKDLDGQPVTIHVHEVHLRPQGYTAPVAVLIDIRSGEDVGHE